MYSTRNSAQCYVLAWIGLRGVWGRMDIGICMAESLYCSPETITTLLIDYEVTQSRRTPCDPMDYVGHQAPLSMECSRQEYWCGLPFPSPGDLRELGTGIEAGSLAQQADFLLSEPPRKPNGPS